MVNEEEARAIQHFYDEKIPMIKCIDCAHMIQANAPYTEDFCSKLKINRSRHAVCRCVNHSPIHESRKGIGPNILDNNGIELEEKNPGTMGGDGNGIGLKKHGDAVKSTHYRVGKIEPIDFIVANQFDFLEGNVIKYISRYKFKGSRIKDLEKAKQYVEWLIERERKRGAE